MKKLFFLARIAACLVIAFCVLEICARVDDSLTDGAPLVGSYGYQAMLTYDDVGVIGKPYAHFRKWRLNKQGYRGPDIRWDRERIICIGASETFGFTESEGMEYPRQLERELNRRVGGEHYQVVNVAYAGQSIGSFSRRADRVAATVKPTVALIYPSSSSYFEISESGDGVDWVKEQPGFQSHLRAKFFDWVDSLPQWTQVMRSKAHIWKETRRKGTIARVPDQNLDRFRHDLDRLLDILQKNRVQAVLMTHATRFGKQLRPQDRSMLIAWRRFTPTLQDDGFLDFENRFNAVIRQEAASHGLLLVDAADRLSGQQNFADFAHFTDRGAELMADFIANQLLGSDRLQAMSHAM